MIWRLLFPGAPFIVVAAAVLLVSVGGCSSDLSRAVDGALHCAANPARCN